MPLPSLVDAWKTIPIAPKWTDPDPADGYTRIYAPLDIEGVTEAGLVLTVGAYATYPERHVTFELCVLDAADRRTRLIRLDWRSLRGGHTNKRRNKCDGPWGRRRVPATHLHAFELNYLPDEQRMKKGKLPCAEPTSEELSSFEDVRKFVGSCFKIKNIEIVPPPDWIYDLFTTTP